MPPADQPAEPPAPKTLPEVVREVGRYPADAYLFVQAALHHTATVLHGRMEEETGRTRHITGGQLCEGIRDFALARWGLLAHTVLGQWGVTETLDFGRIVFALVDGGLMSKTPEDRLEDFADIFDFRAAFEGGYKIGPPCPQTPPPTPKQP